MDSFPSVCFPGVEHNVQPTARGLQSLPGKCHRISAGAPGILEASQPQPYILGQTLPETLTVLPGPAQSLVSDSLPLCPPELSLGKPASLHLLPSLNLILSLNNVMVTFLPLASLLVGTTVFKGASVSLLSHLPHSWKLSLAPFAYPPHYPLGGPE